MNKKKLISVLAAVCIFMTGCLSNGPLFVRDGDRVPGFSYVEDENDDDILSKTDDSEKKNIKFTTMEIRYMKTYQRISDYVEIEDKKEKLIIIDLQPTRTMGVKVDKIEKTDGVYNIFISCSKERSSDIVSPYIKIKLLDTENDFIIKDNIRIIKENFDDIKVKYSYEEALSIIKNEYDLKEVSNPQANLILKNDRAMWNFKFSDVYDSMGKEGPISNMTVVLDSRSGKVLELRKRSESELLDYGKILDIDLRESFLYNKLSGDKNNIYLYDSAKNNKEKLFDFTGNIRNIRKTEDESLLLFNVELPDKKSCVYIYSLSERSLKLISFDKSVALKDSCFKNNNELILLSAVYPMGSKILSYNISTSKKELLFESEDDIIYVNYVSDYYIYAAQYDIMNSLFITKDFNDYNFMENVIKVNAYGEDSILILRSSSDNKKVLSLYNLKTKEDRQVLNMDCDILQKTDKGEFIVLEKTQNAKEYRLIKINFNNMKQEEIKKLNSKSLYYDYKRKILYTSSDLDADKKTPVIYKTEIEKE